ANSVCVSSGKAAMVELAAADGSDGALVDVHAASARSGSASDPIRKDIWAPQKDGRPVKGGGSDRAPELRRRSERETGRELDRAGWVTADAEAGPFAVDGGRIGRPSVVFRIVVEIDVVPIVEQVDDVDAEAQ